MTLKMIDEVSYGNYETKFQKLYNFYIRDSQYKFDEWEKNIDEHKTNYLLDKNFCEDCSVIYHYDIICLKHHKFNYKLEISPSEIGENMFNNIIDNYKNNNYIFIDKTYLDNRFDIFHLLQKVSKNMNFKSQTYFLSIYLLDVIFSNKNSLRIIKINKINYKKLALTCLLIASKYCEIDSFFPQLNSYIKSFENVTYYSEIISKEELLEYEVLTLKLLNYKINYYTIYDFISFFFCHGIIQKQQIDNSNDIHEVKKILEKIYLRARNYLDDIINTDISIKFNSLLLSIYILEKSINEILKDEYTNRKYLSEIFEKIYRINYIYDKEFKAIFEDLNKNQYIKKEVSPLILNDYNENNKNKNNNYNILNGISSYKETYPTRKIYSKEIVDLILNKYQKKLKYKDSYLSNLDVSSSTNFSTLNTSQNNILTNSNIYNNNKRYENHIKNLNNPLLTFHKYNYSNLLRYSIINGNISSGDFRKTKNENINKTNKFSNISRNDISNSFYKTNSSKIINQNINVKYGNINKSLNRNYINHKFSNYKLGL